MKQFLSIAILLLFTSISAFSQVLENAFIVEDKARKAQTIIEGKIIFKHSYFTEGNKAILTDYEIEVYKVFKGNITGETITITEFGGQVGDLSVNMSCYKSNLIIGQTAIYFCEASKWSESPATSQIFSLASSQIIFGYNSYDAIFDKKQSYASREYVYTAIEKATNKEIEQRKLNEFEQQAENWVRSLERNLQSRSGTETLEYNLRNFNVQFPVVEFDITVKANEPDLDFGESEIFLEYSPQIFGNNVVMNSNIIVTKEALILSNDYSLTVNDVAPDELQIDIDLGTNPVILGELTTSEQKLCHLVVNLANVTNSGVIQFEDVNMQGKSYHFDDDTKALDAFETILTGVNWNYVFTDFSFSPQVITGGTGSILTITAAPGTDFGNIEGTVKMANAETGAVPGHPLPAMLGIEEQFVDWSNDTIKVRVPSINGTLLGSSVPASGNIQIEKVNASGSVIATYTSTSQVNVFYSVTNSDDGIGSTATNDAVYSLTKLDTTGGMTFYLSAELDSIPNARAIIEESLCLWKEKTGVNFNLSDSLIVNASADMSDNINTILLVDNPGISMETIRATNNLSTSALGRVTWVYDIDIVINRSTNWNYSLNSPAANQVDFYAAIIHEFGHAHSLNHVIDASPDTLGGRLMYPFLNAGENVSRRIIDTTAFMGGRFVIAHSDTLNDFPSSAGVLPAMEQVLNYDCIINSTNDVEEEEPKVVIFPNPFNDYVNVKYQLTQSSDVFIDVYDITGRLLQRQDLGFQIQGEHQNQINLNLSKGVYFVKLQTNYGFKTIKVIKY
ncbi:MAG: zinc-dependent metalloprotease [Saprospiraceae bacterium]